MKLQFHASLKVAALASALLGLAATAQAQFVAPPPGFTPADTPVAGNTLWHALGIPQGFRKVEDATVNANGNNPEDERTPPLTRIADPQNAQSQNPAIKKAAEIKQEEDKKQQKIKAIKYLATIGCCSYKGVMDALMDALEDPTEEVRFEAAQAIVDLVCYNSAPCIDKCPEDPCKHSFHHDDDGPPCCLKKCLDKLKHCAHLDKKEEKHKQCQLKRAAEDKKCDCNGGEEGGCPCNKCGGCCSEEVTKKLAERAFGRDEKGCLLEPSTRVRAMEKQALCCCCPGQGPEGPGPGPGPGPLVPPVIPPEVPKVPEKGPESVPPAAPEIPGPAPTPPTGNRPLPPPPQAFNAPNQGRAVAPEVLVKNADGKWVPVQSAKVNPQRASQRAETGAPAYLAPMPAARSLNTINSGSGRSLDVADALLPAPPADFQISPIATADASQPKGNPSNGRLTVRPASNQFDPDHRSIAAKPAVVNVDLIPPMPRGQVEADAPSPVRTTSSGTERLVYGRVAQIDVRNRSVLLEFDHGSEPAVGAAISAHHAFLLGVSEVGVLEVTNSRPGTVVAEPAGTLSLGKMSVGDEVVYRRSDR